MKRGFTLLELMVVIIILGIIATLGIQQYFRVVEKSRSSEAKMIMGQIRDVAAGYYIDHQTLAPFDSAAAGIGAGTYLIPETCRNSHYFIYEVIASTPTGFTSLATRCLAGGKSPQGPVDGTVQLVTDFASVAGDQDTWSYDPLYQ